jgi:ADP-heptose:LPS heptosyltransferase
VAALLPGVSAVHTWACPWIQWPAPHADRSDVMRLVDKLTALAFDHMLVFTSFHQSPLPMALLGRLAGIETIAAICEDYPGSLLDLRHAVDEAAPEVERNLSLALAAGFPLAEDDPGRLAVVDDLPAVTGRAAGLPVNGYVVVHPGASVPARRPSARRCAETVRGLAASGWCVVVTGSADEYELCRAVAGSVGHNVAGRLSWGQTAALLRDAAAVVVGNTGVAHLAAAVGTPVVSLFAPTVPAERWAPYGVPSVVLGDQHAACRDTRARECPIPGHPCLSQITAAEIGAAVRALTKVPA